MSEIGFKHPKTMVLIGNKCTGNLEGGFVVVAY